MNSLRSPLIPIRNLPGKELYNAKSEVPINVRQLNLQSTK
jgi:hypothetical protein